MFEHLISITIAIVLDRIIGDPPSWPHPVKMMGTLISKLEKHLNSGNNRKAKGVVMLIMVLFSVILPTMTICWVAYTIHPILGISVEAVIISTTIACKGLRDAALEVYYPLEQNDLKVARRKLSYIVGRDTDKLNESEIVRGTVETVSENTSDGVTAPIFWAFIGGAPLAILYRAINTCDSMVGYKSERYLQFGWASARFDDLVNYIPSRLTGVCMLLANPVKKTTKKRAWEILLRDARRHPSPNSGWCEAATAAILGVQLGGVNTYKGVVSNRALMGESLVILDRNHITQSNLILNRTVLFYLFCLWLGGVLIELAVTWF
jgi:adenosylcobinamide-phosphate synthase